MIYDFKLIHANQILAKDSVLCRHYFEASNGKSVRALHEFCESYSNAIFRNGMDEIADDQEMG